MRRAVLGIAICLVALGCSPGSAAALTWSGPLRLAGSSPEALIALACPASGECVGLDDRSRVVTFNPTAPGTPTAVPVDEANGVDALACPSASQCTAVGGGGSEVTFDPSMPASAEPVVVDPAGQYPQLLAAIACPSTSQCVAVDDVGQEVTFDPDTSPPAQPEPVSLGMQAFRFLSCPATTQCTAIAEDGTSVTFDPGSTAAPVAATIDAPSAVQEVQPAGLACPSISQCTMLDTYGNAVTYDPTSPGTPGRAELFGRAPAPNTAGALACPTATQCVASSSDGATVSFDPDANPLAPPTAVDIFGASGASGASGAYSPAGPGGSSGPAGTGGGVVLACAPAPGNCLAADASGSEVVFSPAAPTADQSFDVDRAGEEAATACPTPAQCTVITPGGEEVTFDPAAPGTPRASSVFSPSQNVAGLACPASTRCVAVDDEGGETATFAPGLPHATVVKTIDNVEYNDSGFGDTLQAVACGAPTECGALDAFGGLYGFAPPPDRRVLTASAASGWATAGPTSISCPSATQCTAVGGGAEITYDPAAPGHPVQATLASALNLNGVACPTASLCVAVSTTGQAVTFNPHSPAQDTVQSVDGAGSLAAIACPTSSQCVAVDDGGHVLSGSPTALGSWSTAAPTDADAFTDVACGSATACVAVDTAGNVFLGGRAAPGSPASLTATQFTRAIAPRGAARRIAAILAAKGYALTFPAPAPGHLTLRWSALDGPLLASVATTLPWAGPQTVPLTLTPAGRRLLRDAEQVAVIATGRFAGRTVSAHFTLS